MSLFFERRVQPEQRAISGADWIRGLGGDGSRTKAGQTVTPNRSLQLGSVWASTNLLASVVSNLPVDVFRGTGVSKTPVSPQPALVAAPSLIVSRREWTYQAMMSLLLRGNAYGLVLERDAILRPRTVEWLNPDNVEVDQPSSIAAPTYKVGGTEVPLADMIHMRAFLQPGSAIGLSPVAYHAESIGVGLAAQQFGAQWFADGATPTAIMKNSERTIKSKDATRIKRRLVEALRGKREPLVIGKDWDYKPISVPANESQFLDAQGYTDAQVARIYGPGVAEVLGYETGGTLTYSNRVDRSLDLLTYAVLPWIGKFEDMLTAAVAQPQTVRYNTNGLLRADPKTRHEMYRTDREIGLYNLDELRGFEDQPPLPDGQGQDYTPLKLVQPAAAPTPGGPNDQ